MKLDNTPNTPSLWESIGTEPKVMWAASFGTLILGTGLAISFALGMSMPLAVPVVLITAGFMLFFSAAAVNGVQWDRRDQVKEDDLRAQQMRSKKDDLRARRVQSKEDAFRARMVRSKETIHSFDREEITPAECFKRLRTLGLKPEWFNLFAEQTSLGDQCNELYRLYYLNEPRDSGRECLSKRNEKKIDKYTEI